MNSEFYQCICDNMTPKFDLWIQGDSDSGKTTYLKYLFDRDRIHDYKWLIGGCSPSKTEVYYHRIIQEILQTTYKSNITMAIYIDEILNCYLEMFIELRNKLDFPVHFVIVSHHYPQEEFEKRFIVLNMTEILPLKLLRKYIDQNCDFSIPNNIDLNISVCFYLISNMSEITTINDFMILYEKGKINNNLIKKSKMSVEYNIWILKTEDYEHVNILKIKEG